ncbi:MAG: transcription termination/antitermination factor NusG [Clostridiales bacterium]|nr:MAG: transcription termination/antitermination factor NusG [Clostridiales bacterium]
MAEKAKWYAIHTYSAYENKVATNLRRIIENRKLEEVIQDISVPTETVVETTEKGQKEYERKVFPGYVLVKMVLTDETWYIVRNIQGVTGFVGSTSEPLPLTQAEIDKLGVEKRVVHTDYKKGDSVRFIASNMSGFVGVVDEVFSDSSRLKVVVSMFGRETSVEVGFDQVAPVE